MIENILTLIAGGFVGAALEYAYLNRQTEAQHLVDAYDHFRAVLAKAEQDAVAAVRAKL